MTRRECNDLPPQREEQWIHTHKEGAGLRFGKCTECIFDFGGACRVKHKKTHAHGTRRSHQLLYLSRKVGRVYKECDRISDRHNFVQHLEPLGGHFV